MKVENIFRQIPKFNNIKLDTVLFEAKYPVLFTCKNFDDIYMFICCTVNADIIKWIATKTDYSILISLLENRITIREAFLHGKEEKIVINYDGISVKYFKEESNNIPDDLLPTEGEYMDAEEGEFADEIAIFKLRSTTREVALIPRKDNLFTFRIDVSSVTLTDDYFRNEYIDIPEKVFRYGGIARRRIALAQ